MAPSRVEARPKYQWVHSSKYSGTIANFESDLLVLKGVRVVDWRFCYLFFWLKSYLLECQKTSYDVSYSTEDEYKALANATTELMWVETLLIS
jgi:hypothetical protein